MLALVLLVLSVLAAPVEGRAEGTPVGQAESVVVTWEGSGCCGEITEADTPHPCAPGESCPGSGGCCACVSCCKRVANEPSVLRPREVEDTTSHVIPSGRRAGTEKVGAVWHPPRG